MLLNLQSNALKFTKSGGSIDIIVTKIQESSQLASPEFEKYFKMAKYGMVEISVIDTGIGIKKKDHHKLFELFGFLDSSKELNQKGIGLGLHISKQIVQ